MIWVVVSVLTQTHLLSVGWLGVLLQVFIGCSVLVPLCLYLVGDLKSLDRYKQFRRNVSRNVGGAVFTTVSWLENQSKKGLLVSRLRFRLANRVHEGILIHDRNLQKPDGIGSLFTNAFHFRFYTYSKILLVVFGVMLVDYSSTCSITGTRMGLYASFLTLVGTLIFSRSLFQGFLGLRRKARRDEPLKDSEFASELPDDVDPEALITLSYSSTDAVWATVFVMLGFGFTVLTTFPATVPIPC